VYAYVAAMIEAQAEEAGESASGDGIETKSGGLGKGSKMSSAVIGRGAAEVGTRASAYAPSQSAGGMAAAMSGGGGVGRSTANDKPLITFPDPGQLDSIKNKQQVVLRIEDLSFSYPSSPAPVLDGVNARVYLSSRVAIVGANGAGKTTLLKNMVGGMCKLNT
jgi:ATPase subunit of ABC transporter with duplicated ATPase domains